MLDRNGDIRYRVLLIEISMVIMEEVGKALADNDKAQLYLLSTQYLSFCFSYNY